jgi:exodeoxyribonuclease-1
MKSPDTFLWHDYETFGTRPMYDRPAQFAAVRTDADLNPVGEELSFFCAPADDVLPHPAACLITGITPQIACQQGLPETAFAARILDEMMQAGTCSAGYNSIRFDDVFTRNLLYRNLRDPYEREYHKGNSRWDLIDLARMCYALRPQGIAWPLRAPAAGSAVQASTPSFKLEDLTKANGIEHAGAHEALADVRATIALARMLKQAQPRLYDWALGLRDQKTAMALLDPIVGKPVVHTSSRIPALRGCTTLELPLAVLPNRPKSVVAFDLMADPGPLIEEPADVIADLVFTPVADLPEGVARLPLKVIHSNHLPMIAPAASLHEVDTARIQLDVDRCQQHARLLLQAMPRIRPKVIEVFSRSFDDEGGSGHTDPDQLLYSGGFFAPSDKFLMRKILDVAPGELSRHIWSFKDERLPLMVFRYRARNFPETLSAQEREAWDQDRVRRLINPADPEQFSFGAYRAAIAEFRISHAGDSRAQLILDKLEIWGQETGLERLWHEQHSGDVWA